MARKKKVKGSIRVFDSHVLSMQLDNVGKHKRAGLANDDRREGGTPPNRKGDPRHPAELIIAKSQTTF